MNESDYMNQKQAMAYLGIANNSTFQNLVKAGLPVMKVGHMKRYSKRSIDKFLHDHEICLA